MLERDSFRKLDDWTMGSHMKQRTLSYAENNFGGRTVFPVWQMVQDDDEDDDNVNEELDAESVAHLRGNVRACYLNHLEKIVIRNYETCSDKDRTEWPFSRADLLKCAAWMEYKALRSCMVVILYQRAMTRLAADIKKHTEQLKIYTKLKHFMSFDTGWSTKTTQTCEQHNFTDQATQTDLGGEIHLYTDTNECGFDNRSLQTGLETDEANCHSDETVQGVPIPVYVSGISSAGFKSRNTQNMRVVKNIKPVPLSEINTLQNGVEPVLSRSIELPNTSNGLEPPSRQRVDVPVGVQNTVEPPSRQRVDLPVGVQNTVEPLPSAVLEEPYVWSVIEGKNEIKLNRRPRVRVRRLRKMQESKPVSNGMFSLDEEDEETRKMSIDERIAVVLGIENPEFSEEEEVLSEKSAMEVDEEPSIWTLQKCEHQEVLRAKIIEKCIVNVRKRGQMRLRFLELFGSDSEDCFDIDEDVTNYKDKLARWVVVSLMPYYREGRIISRPVFKYLARHIADQLLKTNRWPSESDVMQSVVEFFSYHSKIECENDI